MLRTDTQFHLSRKSCTLAFSQYIHILLGLTWCSLWCGSQLCIREWPQEAGSSFLSLSPAKEQMGEQLDSHIFLHSSSCRIAWFSVSFWDSGRDSIPITFHQKRQACCRNRYHNNRQFWFSHDLWLAPFQLVSSWFWTTMFCFSQFGHKSTQVSWATMQPCHHRLTSKNSYAKFWSPRTTPCGHPKIWQSRWEGLHTTLWHCPSCLTLVHILRLWLRQVLLFGVIRQNTAFSTHPRKVCSGVWFR